MRGIWQVWNIISNRMWGYIQYMYCRKRTNITWNSTFHCNCLFSFGHMSILFLCATICIYVLQYFNATISTPTTYCFLPLSLNLIKLEVGTMSDYNYGQRVRLNNSVQIISVMHNMDNCHTVTLVSLDLISRCTPTTYYTCIAAGIDYPVVTLPTCS